jgi:Na+/H+-dicarboxylate symporter
MHCMPAYSHMATVIIIASTQPIALHVSGLHLPFVGDQLLPRNVIKAYYSTNLLGLIVFSILLGNAISKQPNSEPIFAQLKTVADAIMSLVMVIVEFTPIGIGSLIAKGVGAMGDESLAPYIRFIVSSSNCARAPTLTPTHKLCRPLRR